MKLALSGTIDAAALVSTTFAGDPRDSVPTLSPVAAGGGRSGCSIRTSKQDLRILSVPLALSLSYALNAMDLNINLGFAKIATKGVSGEQQMKVVNKTVDPLLKVLQVGRR